MSEFVVQKVSTDEWYTPPFVFEAFGIAFDLDPCAAPDGKGFVPAKMYIRPPANGLYRPWSGRVFMNPPYGKREGHVPWLRKFLDHGNGIAVVRAYTSAGWFHDLIPEADGVFFPRGKTKFVNGAGGLQSSPSHGVVFLARGGEMACILDRCRDQMPGIFYRQWPQTNQRSKLI